MKYKLRYAIPFYGNLSWFRDTRTLHEDELDNFIRVDTVMTCSRVATCFSTGLAIAAVAEYLL